MEHSVPRRIDMTRLLKLILISSAFLLTACGGGGGDGDDTTAITYTGLKTPAVITSNNAVTLAEGIVGPDIDAFGSSGIVGVVTEDGETLNSTSNLTLAQMFADVARQMDFSAAMTLPGVVQTQTDTLPCDSGSIYLSITVDDATGDFSGNMTFQDCVTENVYMDGTAYFTGTIDVSTLDNFQMTLTFSNLIERYDNESYTFSGQIEMTISASSVVEVIDYYVRDNNTLSVYWYATYTIEIVDNVSEALIRISGRFYHPDYGYVDISTINTLRMNYTEALPYTGILVASGDSSSLMLDCEGDSILTYTLSVDADGDGIYETATLENW
jgi:hypothetical protein